ncbi:MAG: hypothetical protein LBJ99_05045 [Oscillospiraceae bacterium]|jgi:YbbR domain-containing protein|nr:hypothetical protein [Oscillospiraceae bacterium]
MLKKIGRFFSSRTFYIAFSLAAAVALWIYVEFVVNPEETNYISGIPVEFINSELVSDRNLVITSVSTQTVGLRLTGRRNVVMGLGSSDIKVTVDLAQITGVGQSMLGYTEAYPDGVSTRDFTVSERSVSYIVLRVENLSEKMVEVSGEYSGNIAAEGYQAEPLEFQPNMIKVTGPEALVSRVAKVLVAVLRENLTKTVTEEYPFTLFDEDGAQLDVEGLTFSDQIVAVTVPIKTVRTVPLTVNLVPGAGADESNTTVTVTPGNEITLAGDAADMQINYILLGTIDLTRFSVSLTESFPIIIPNGLDNLTGLTNATVTVKISGLETRQFQVSNIQISNVPSGYEATLITQSLNVTIRGAPDDMERLQQSNISVVADLTELGNTSGMYTVPARVYVGGEFGDIGAIGEYPVAVSLSEPDLSSGGEAGGGA